MMNPDQYKIHLDAYLVLLNKKSRHSVLVDGGNSTFDVTHGKRWDKIIMKENGKIVEVFAFVDPNNGLIYKPASWHAPAKHARGNIFGGTRPLSIGDLYLR